MKFTHTRTIKALLSFSATLVAFSNPAVHAESQYGYSPSGNSKVTATASVNVKVTVPTLILLRIDDPKDVTKLSFQAIPNVTDAPLSAELGAIASDVSNQATSWDGSAPTFATPDGQKVPVWAWTNSKNGGNLAVKTTVNTLLSGLDASSITVTHVAGSGGMPTHPATTADANIGDFKPNTVHTATWIYSVDPAALAAAASGTYEQTSVYTATAL